MLRKNVIFKTIDVSKRKDGESEFNNEVKIYEALESLQGICIPRLLGYGTLGGLLLVIVLENVGRVITREEVASRKTEISRIIERINSLGVTHGDIRMPNILVREEDKKIFLVDFGMSKREKVNSESSEVPLLDEPYFFE